MMSPSAFLSLSLLLVAGTVVARTEPGKYGKSVMKNRPIPEASQVLDHPDAGKKEHFGYEKQDPIRDYWNSATGNQPMPEAIQGLVRLETGKGDRFVKNFTTDYGIGVKYQIGYAPHKIHPEAKREKPSSGSNSEPGHR
ncbi:hypothetical protein F0562_028596 [Nyssa sinensis]|uniref:BURP domain-containing protein n=1 Tax=Nyssa sinensis TaxID=561372 RepID=A0A5J5B0N8_9ASTE|nr:hypothetical protein F0562_028596 [Nyssa sinensis]